MVSSTYALRFIQIASVYAFELSDCMGTCMNMMTLINEVYSINFMSIGCRDYKDKAWNSRVEKNNLWQLENVHCFAHLHFSQDCPVKLFVHRSSGILNTCLCGFHFSTFKTLKSNFQLVSSFKHYICKNTWQITKYKNVPNQENTWNNSVLIMNTWKKIISNH